MILNLRFRSTRIGITYYPGDTMKCCDIDIDDDKEFCKVPSNSCLFLKNSPFQAFESFSTLTVGFEESDSSSANEFSFGEALPGQ